MNNWVLRVIAYSIILFILAPILIVFISSFTASNYVAFPPEGLSIKWYMEAFKSTKFIKATGISLFIAFITAIISCALALAVTFAIERYTFKGKDILNTLFFAPLTMPMIGLGIGLLFFLTATGIVRTNTALILSHTVVAIPYAIRALSSVVGSIDIDVERSALMLGANPFTVLYKITLPMIMPGLMAAWMFSFLISFNNVTISIFIVGPKTETLPIALYHLTENSLSPMIASIATIAILIAGVIVVVLEKRFGVYGMLGKGR